MKTPLKPKITIEARKFQRVCGCCGVENPLVRVLSFGWALSRYESGATCVALCPSCRKATAKALISEL